VIGTWHKGLFILVVILPFLGQAYPIPGAVPLFLPISLMLAPLTLLIRVADRGVPGVVVGDIRFLTVLVITVLTYLYGIVLSTEMYYEFLLREIGNGVIAVMIVFSIANSGWSAAEMARLVRTAATVILLIGVFVSALGAYKFWMFVSSGEQLQFILAASGVEYPWGTSLVTDYNFFALTIITAILSGLFLASGARPRHQALLAILVVFMFVVGILAGSRRFWLVAPLFVIAQCLWMVLRHGIQRNGSLLGTLMLCLVGLPVVLYVIASDVFEVVIAIAWDFQYRLSTIFDSDTGFGMGSRFGIWSFAIDRLEGSVPWFGDGFDYMGRFSCEFAQCGGEGYPHMPILSGYLYGGVIAAIANSALYVYITVAGLKALATRFEFAWLCFPLFSTLLFAAISGNGSLSIRSFVVLGAVCAGFLWASRIATESDEQSASTVPV